MNEIILKLVAAGVLFIFILISGLIVSHSGRPLNIWLVGLHKLIAIGAVVLISIAINQLLKTTGEKTIILISTLLITAVLFIAMIATGALLTREEMQLPGIVLKIHQVAPFLSLAFSGLSVYLLARGLS